MDVVILLFGFFYFSNWMILMFDVCVNMRFYDEDDIFGKIIKIFYYFLNIFNIKFYL